MNTTKVLIAGSVLAIAAYFVVGSMKGGSAPDAPREEWFSKLDANKDGELAPEEVKATAANNMDANKDGLISLEEMKTYRSPRHNNV